ncbi:GNAT family N-acetyltransferase [Actinomycetospora termitidis]|uniref:GNAT family N-acetyltransferase n=1 Tax=Actinomycetospora termitidis TaxID=3053470 RepID=A0ABT7M3G8_9PSEU|nr:GNAT family N-acetyltransferase [Actinomycetospora sp. Odt1-22]MDL5155215.1 GNAT family N-acetyltransferase [Actinomycetospora sp. Odt1-22]
MSTSCVCDAGGPTTSRSSPPCSAPTRSRRPGATPGTGDLADYERAFAAIDADPRHLLVVATDRGGPVVGTLQLSFLPGLARRGAWRGQIEAVHVAASHRGLGLGGWMIRWAVDESRRRGCGLVQLTSAVERRDAHRFYERLGFTASHVGFKLTL